MSFILITAIAQLLNSVVALIDKFIVTSKQVPRPELYVFYSGIFAFLSILLYAIDPIINIFFEVNLPSILNVTTISMDVVIVALISTVSMLVALYFMYKALCCGDASDVVPVVGSISAFFTLSISYVFLGKILSPSFAWGFVLLVLGTFLVSKFRFDKPTLINTLLSGVFFSVNAITLKLLLDSLGFDNGFFWFSVIMTLVSLSMLFSKSVRNGFTHHRKSKKAGKSFVLIFGNKLLAGIAGILLIKATAMGDVSIVQALTGLQFMFLFVIAVIIGPYTDVDLGENIKRKDLYQKLISISIIFTGFVLLFI